MLYRIYTEDVGNDKAKAIAAEYFDAFTVFKGQGYWRNEPEFSLVVEVFTEDDAAVIACADEIKHRLEQQTVLVVQIPVTQVTFV